MVVVDLDQLLSVGRVVIAVVVVVDLAEAVVKCRVLFELAFAAALTGP